MPSLAEQSAQLEAAIAALDAQRLILGDATVETSVATLRAQLAALQPGASGTAQVNSSPVDAHLDQLSHADLIRLQSAQAEPIYIFKHALVQDAAYQSMLRADQRVFHRKVAQTYERVYATQLDQFAPLLGQHWANAGEDAHAAQYFVRAGDAATRIFAPVEAREHYAHALEHLARLTDSNDNRRLRMDTTIKYAMVAFGSEQPDRILRRLMDADALAQQLSTSKADRLLRANSRYWIGRLHNILNDPQAGIRDNEQVLAEAQALDEADLAAMSSGEIGLIRVRLGQYGSSDALLTPAIEYYERMRQWQQWIYLIAHQSMALTARGQVAEGLGAGQRMLARATELNAPSAIAVSNLFLTHIYMLAGELRRARAAAETTIQLAEQTGELLLVNMGRGFHAWVVSRLDDMAAARASAAIQDETVRMLGGQFVLPEQFAAMRAEVALRDGQFDEAILRAQQAIAIATPLGGIFGIGLAQRVWALALAHSGLSAWKDGDEHFAASRDAFIEGEALVEVARTDVSWGITCRQRGNADAARSHWERAAAQFAASGLQAELEQTRGLVSATAAVGV